jgi:hypothetical protein
VFLKFYLLFILIKLRISPIYDVFILVFLEADKCDIPELHVKEWIWSRSNPYQSPALVRAEQIGWGVPTIQRLWFGYVLFSNC